MTIKPNWLKVASLSGALLALTYANASAADDKATLTLLSSATAAPALRQAIGKFQAANPNVSIEVSVAPDASMNVLLPQQLAAGNGSDIYVDWPGIYSTQAVGVLAKNGYSLDVSDEAWAKSLSGTLRTLSGYDGKIYFAPLVALGFSTTYNQTAIDKAGLKIPTKWDEVLTFCKEAKAKGLVPFALGAQTGSQAQMPAMAMGATVIDRDMAWTEQRTAGKSAFATSGWLTVFEKFQEMNKGGCFSQPLGTSEDVARSLLASGKALGFFGPSSAFQIIQGMTKDHLVFTTFPATNNSDETLLCVGIGSGLSINSKTKYPEQAKKFLAFMMEPENTNDYAKATSQVPAIPNDKFSASDPATSVILKAMADKKTAPLTNQMWPNPRIVPAQRTATQQMLGGSSTPQDVAKVMDQAWDQP
jgi:raffinose/stachyose/melibiose transport system substrate-binding protein